MGLTLFTTGLIGSFWQRARQALGPAMSSTSTLGWRGSLLSVAILSLATVLTPSTALAQASAAKAEKTPPPPVARKAGEKVLRYAFRVAETGFDPVQVSDLYSGNIIAQIFDTPLTYDYLSDPPTIVPKVTTGMPEVSADGLTMTMKIKPGIYFADDPVFGGKKRELVAQDFVYSVKRHYDPVWRSPNHYILKGYLAGLDALRDDAVKNKKPFDYDKEVEGVRALDKYTFQVKLAKPNTIFMHYLTYCNLFCAVSREVVEKYGRDAKGAWNLPGITAKPVGTGPYMLKDWRRASRMIFERNPGFREEYYNAKPNVNDKFGQEAYAEMKGKRIPQIDRVEVYIVDEQQPRWLAFENLEHDMIEEVPPEFANMLLPNGVIAPNLAARGIRMQRVEHMSITYTFFNMDEPLVGGMDEAKVAFRRAIALGYNTDEEIRIIRRNQAIRAQQVVAPGAIGYNPQYRNAEAAYDPARAKALLDLYGYKDVNGDGYREQPNGQPLVLELATTADQQGKQFDELWKKSMDSIGLRIKFIKGKWPEHLKAARAGKLMMWQVGWSAAVPDAGTFFTILAGESIGGANYAKFNQARYNELFAKSKAIQPGPEQDTMYKEMNNIIAVYRPAIINTHRLWTDMKHPWVLGYRKHPVLRETWKYLDIDLAKQPKS